MTTPKITYAHLLTEPNPKHVESLIKFFESGCQQRGTGGFGVEIEHLPVHNSDDTAVTYYESNGIEALLNRIRPYYDENKEYWENGRLVGLAVTASPYLWNRADSWKRPSASCTSRRSSPHCTARSAAKSDPILEELGFRLVNYGYQPKSSYADIPVNPKDRYKAMTAYLGRVGQFGPCMMRCSASTQVSIDYVSEQDAIAKLRLAR